MVNRLSRLLFRSARIEAHELRACLVSFFLVFTLMGAYYILRPIRDGMASDWSDAEVSFLWTLNFFISTTAVAVYGWAVRGIRFDWLVPSVYIFFASSFVAFYILETSTGHPRILDKSFYVWVSVFSLFHVSVFWSFMSDLYSKEQASRLFAIIGSGASAGALIGPAIPTLLAGYFGNDTLMLVAAALVVLAVPQIFMLSRLKLTELGNAGLHADLSKARIGGNPFAGFRMFFSNRYLMGIGLFIILYTALGSIVYFQQKNLLADYTRAERTQILGGVDWVVNVLTFGIAFFATSRLVTFCGMPFTLSSVPFFMLFGFLALMVSPVLLAALALQVARRAGNYAVTRPGREMLFTLVDRETRFKAKPVIDIVAYRGGDMLTSWGFAGMTQGLGWGLGAIAGVGALVAALWGLVGIFLGRRFEHDRLKEDAVSTEHT